MVILDEAALGERLVTQVDLAEIALEPGIRVFENLAARARVEASTGDAWRAEAGAGYGPAGSGTVRVADNADAGWAPGWAADEWANRLSAREGEVWFRPDPRRRGLAVGLAAVVVAALVAAVVGRRKA